MTASSHFECQKRLTTKFTIRRAFSLQAAMMLMSTKDSAKMITTDRVSTGKWSEGLAHFVAPFMPPWEAANED